MLLLHPNKRIFPTSPSVFGPHTSAGATGTGVTGIGLTATPPCPGVLGFTFPWETELTATHHHVGGPPASTSLWPLEAPAPAKLGPVALSWGTLLGVEVAPLS